MAKKTKEIRRKLDTIEKWRYFQSFNPEEIELLVELALSGEYPDGTYSDTECVAWELIRRALRKGGVNV